MADLLKDYETDFDDIITSIDRGINDIPNLSKRPEDLIDKYELLSTRLNRAKQILRSYKIDLRELPKDEQIPYQTKAKEFEERIKLLNDELNWLLKKSKNGETGAAGAEINMAQAKMLQKQDLEATNKMEEKGITLEEWIGNCAGSEEMIIDGRKSKFNQCLRKMRSMARRLLKIK